MNQITITAKGKVHIHLHHTALPAVQEIKPLAAYAEQATTSESTLVWSQTLLKGERVNFETAEKAVAELGEGWRLPTRTELLTLVDDTRHEPAIDTKRFPDTKSSAYWTGTPCAWNESARWVVGFGDGNVFGFHRSGSACVRAVRASQ